jgi:hypothetical protein
MKLFIGMLLLLLLPTTIFAADGPKIYPVRELFGFPCNDIEKCKTKTKDQVALDRQSTLTVKAPAFFKWVTTRGLDNLADAFDAEFRKEFGQLAAVTITDVNKHEVLVASLHLIRSSQYHVPKNGIDEIHLPITLSIIITNPSTGEALYSFTDTSYAVARTTGNGADHQAERLLFEQTEANYRSLLHSIIQKAKAGYSPAKIEVKAVTSWKGLIILDKGSKAGIARDDSLIDKQGNELSVKYVTEQYAVASPLLGKVQPGDTFYKYANLSTVNQFVKPKVLTMHEGWKNGSLIEISRFFDSEVSKESAFTLLPTNEYFKQMLSGLARDTTSGSHETTQMRVLPDYMIKFSAGEPRIYKIIEPGKFGYRVYEQHVLGELLDRQGRIIYAAVGSNEIQDKDVAGMVFDETARREIILKNATKHLAEQFNQSIKFSHFVLPVTGIDGKLVVVADKPRELRIGQGVTVYRSLGKQDGINDTVTVPIWEASVVEAHQGKVRLDPIMSLGEERIKIVEGDMVIIDAITSAETANQSETSANYCAGITPNLGKLVIQDFPIFSRAFGHLLPYTLYDTDSSFTQKVKDALYLGGFRDRDQLKFETINTAGRCVLPLYKAAITKRECENGSCDLGVSLATGYRPYRGQEKQKATAQETTINIKQCRENAIDPIVQNYLTKNLLGILKETAPRVRFQ